MLILLVLFIVIPITEVTIIDRVQEALGWPTTILILALDSVVGAYLVRMQGAKAWKAFTASLGEARMPAEEVVDGALIVFGGALLLTPGFFTDVVGLACVLTPTRRLLNRLVRSRFQVMAGPMGSMFMVGGRPGRRPGRAPGGPDAERPRPPGPPGAIDVEVLDVKRTPRRPDGDPGASDGPAPS